MKKIDELNIFFSDLSPKNLLYRDDIWKFYLRAVLYYLAVALLGLLFLLGHIQSIWISPLGLLLLTFFVLQINTDHKFRIKKHLDKVQTNECYWASTAYKRYKNYLFFIILKNEGVLVGDKQLMRRKIDDIMEKYNREAVRIEWKPSITKNNIVQISLVITGITNSYLGIKGIVNNVEIFVILLLTFSIFLVCANLLYTIIEDFINKRSKKCLQLVTVLQEIKADYL